jgi:hypothetical protein
MVPMPGVLILEYSIPIPGSLIAAVLALVICEAIWRSGLRPRIIWNEFGLTLVYPFRIAPMRWSAVSSIVEIGNRVVVSRIGGKTCQWEFDHVWWLAKASRRYAERAGQNETRLRAALNRRTATSEFDRPPPQLVARRPVVFLPIIGVTALLAHFMTPIVLSA